MIGRLGPAANLVFDAPGIRLVGAMKVTRDVSAVTGACCLIRRSAWEAIGGFDEDYAIAYNDVDFCLRLRAHGYRVLYTPHVTLIHDESSSRGALHPAKDEARLLRQWSAEIAAGDPFFPPGLRLGTVRDWNWRRARPSSGDSTPPESGWDSPTRREPVDQRPARPCGGLFGRPAIVGPPEPSPTSAPWPWRPVPGA